MNRNYSVRVLCALVAGIVLLSLAHLIAADAGAKLSDKELLKEQMNLNKELGRLFYEYIQIIHDQDDSRKALTAEERAKKFADIYLALPNLKERMEKLDEKAMHPQLSKLNYLKNKLHRQLLILQKEKEVKLPAKIFAQPCGSNQRAGALSPAAPPNDNCSSAIVISNGTYTGETATATNDGSTSCGASSTSPDVWYKYNAAADGIIIFDTLNSSYDTVLSAHMGCPGNESNEITCNDDCGNLQSCLPLNVTAGDSYYIRVSGYAQDSGNYELHAGPTGTISGTVTDAANGDPIPNLPVWIYTPEGNWETWTYTDSTGYYETEAITPGVYVVLTESETIYIDEIYNNIPCEPFCNTEIGTPVMVIAGQNTTGINFALDVGGSISGTISDADTGEHLSFLEVDIYDQNGEFKTSAISDSNGDYINIDPLIGGTYFAYTFAPWDSYIDELYNNYMCDPYCDPTAGTPIQVNEGQTTSGINFGLKKGGKISGALTDAQTGLPITGCLIEVWDINGNPTFTTAIDSAGHYLTDVALLAGTYFVTTICSSGYVNEVYNNMICQPVCDPTMGTPVDVQQYQTTPDIDFALNQSGIITGTITDAITGLPLSGIDVSLYNSAGVFVDGDFTDSNGNYHVGQNLQTGKYFLKTSTSNYINKLYDNIICEPDCNPVIGKPISVTAGQTTSGINFAIGHGGTITGTVTDASTHMPLIAIEIKFYDINGNYVTNAYSNGDGSYFSLDPLLTGTYFAATSNANSYIDKLYNNMICEPECDPTTGTPILVTIGHDTAGINFALDQGGTISGTVTDSITNQGIGYVNIHIYDSSGVEISNVYTNSSGVYTAQNALPAGNYFALTTNIESYADELYNNFLCEPDCDPSSGTPIPVTNGQNTGGINFALDQTGKISGTVMDEVTGLPVAGCYVEIYDSNGNSVTEVATDNSGYYITTDVLLTGNYFVRTSCWGIYVNELYNDMVCQPDCDPTNGDAVPVILNQTTSGINFVLGHGGRIAGTITNASTGLPLSDIYVNIFDSNGYYITYAVSDMLGKYITNDALVTGNYFAYTDSYYNFIDKLYDDIVCEPYCDPTTGTPIPVTNGQTKFGIDFNIQPGGSISGKVTDAVTGDLLDALVYIYDSTGNFLFETHTYGEYNTWQPLFTGNYYAIAHTIYNCYADELYNNIPCDSCNPTDGNAIPVVVGANTPNINFTLDRALRLTSLGMSVNDSASSHPNGIIDLDEPVELTGLLENSCTIGRAQSVTGTITSSDPIIINNANATYPDIAPQHDKICTSCYNITAPSANKPPSSNHWDITLTEATQCSACVPSSNNFIFHIGNSFTDVQPNNMFYPMIERIFHYGVTNGCTSTMYCPGAPVQRQHIAKFICNAMNAVNPSSCVTAGCNATFGDVAVSNMFCPYVEALYNAGIVSGCQASPLLYCPNINVQRQTMAKFVCLAMEAVNPGSCQTRACQGIFSDVSTSNLFCPYIEALFYAGVVSGCQQSPLLYCPSLNITRAQMAKYLVNGFNL